METLAKPLRKQLEDAVVKARDEAENAARTALMHLAVGDAEAPKHLTDDERDLRRRLRAHGRQVGDHRRPDGYQAIDHLAQETAYEHWHRMLFARFLAENSLLMHPGGVSAGPTGPGLTLHMAHDPAYVTCETWPHGPRLSFGRRSR